MSNQGKHIHIFEELVRVLSLKTPDDIIPSPDIHYIPADEKSQNLIHELITYQNKINRRKFSHRVYYSLLITGILLLSFLLCVRNFHDREEQNQDVPAIREQNQSLHTDSVLPEPHPIADAGSQVSKSETGISDKTKAIKRDTLSILVVDTLHSKVYQTDTIINQVVITDTLRIEHDEPKIHTGSYCLLPQRYTLLYNEKAVFVDEKYQDDILEIANTIRECHNLQNIEITGYYTQRFLFFSNRKLVQQRIETLKREIGKQNVSSRALRKSKEYLVKIRKTDDPGSTQRVDIMLTD